MHNLSEPNCCHCALFHTFHSLFIYHSNHIGRVNFVLIIWISPRHTETHATQSRPTQGVCTVPGRGAISHNSRKLVSVICCRGGLHWHCRTLDRSRRGTDREPGRGGRGGGGPVLTPSGKWPERTSVLHIWPSPCHIYKSDLKKQRSVEFVFKSKLNWPDIELTSRLSLLLLSCVIDSRPPSPLPWLQLRWILIVPEARFSSCAYDNRAHPRE